MVTTALIILAVIFHARLGQFISKITTRISAPPIMLMIDEIGDGIAVDTTSQLLKKTGFWLSYNEMYEQADWTAYIFTREMVERGSITRSDDFRPDTAVLTGSAQLGDYRGSGYHRGHLVPAGDMTWSEIAMSESFLLSNMSPQVAGFNQGIWKRLENRVRIWAVENDSIYVITGPVLSNVEKTIGENGVGVPGYYFKIIMDISYPTYKGIGFLMKNESNPADIFEFAVTIDYLEELLNYNFFPDQPIRDIEYVESRVDVRDWR